MILFLDFDGVLHPEYEDQAVPEDVAFCHLPRFEAVLRDFPQVEVVISSAWRHHRTLDQLRERFAADLRHRVVGLTPSIDGTSSRQQRDMECLQWLSTHRTVDTSWIALDDATWLFRQYLDKVVPCVSWRGFDAAAEAELRRRLAEDI